MRPTAVTEIADIYPSSELAISPIHERAIDTGPPSIPRPIDVEVGNVEALKNEVLCKHFKLKK